MRFGVEGGKTVVPRVMCMLGLVLEVAHEEDEDHDVLGGRGALPLELLLLGEGGQDGLQECRRAQAICNRHLHALWGSKEERDWRLDAYER
jgi:hypothetical protein